MSVVAVAVAVAVIGKILKMIFSCVSNMLNIFWNPSNIVRIFKNVQGEEQSSKITWLAGEARKDSTSGFWIKVFNGERPPKSIVTVHNKKIGVKQIVEGPEKVAPIQNDVPIDGERYGFKPFWLGKAGNYVLKYVAVLGDREICSAKVDIEVKGMHGTYLRFVMTCRYTEMASHSNGYRMREYTYDTDFEYVHVTKWRSSKIVSHKKGYSMSKKAYDTDLDLTAIYFYISILQKEKWKEGRKDRQK